MLALHVRGDTVSRSNIPNRPHLDRLSGVCCWHEAMPETSSILDAVARPANLHLVDASHPLKCDGLLRMPGPVVLIWDDARERPSPGLAACRASLPAQIYGSRDGWPAFRAAPLLSGGLISPTRAGP
jgi:hypothetical protein